jgi:hypothetical protein
LLDAQAGQEVLEQAVFDDPSSGARLGEDAPTLEPFDGGANLRRGRRCFARSRQRGEVRCDAGPQIAATRLPGLDSHELSVLA